MYSNISDSGVYMGRYALYRTVNDKETVMMYSNGLESVEKWYNDLVSMNNSDDIDHVTYRIYDFEEEVNIKSYDSQADNC